MASGSSRNNGLTLTDMPNEILRNIASRLELKEWRLWFVKTSRQCREIGEAILYQDWKEKSEYHEGHADIYLYLRTLLNRPDLAKHVNTFTGDGVGYAEEPNEEWMSLKDTIFDKSDWNRIEEIIRSRWRGHEQSKLLEGLRAGEWDPAVTLLYSLMPNLEEISLGKWYECGPILSGYIEQAGLCQRGIETSLEISSAVPKLSKVSLQFHDTEGGMEPSELHMWSALKSMRVLQGHMIGDDNQEDPDSEFSDGKTPRNEEQSRCMVEKLVFTYSTIDANGLADILFAYPHLKHFEYDYGGAMVAAAAFEPPKIRRALLEVKDTLEYLSLKDDDGNKEDEYIIHNKTYGNSNVLTQSVASPVIQWVLSKTSQILKSLQQRLQYCLVPLNITPLNQSAIYMVIRHTSPSSMYCHPISSSLS